MLNCHAATQSELVHMQVKIKTDFAKIYFETLKNRVPEYQKFREMFHSCLDFRQT